MYRPPSGNPCGENRPLKNYWQGALGKASDAQLKEKRCEPGDEGKTPLAAPFL